ncbi:MAG: phosphotransferase [Cyclobacteriaceae bacterium]
MSSIEKEILKFTKAFEVIRIEPVQELWSGYGIINRYYLNGGDYSSVIVKHVQLSNEQNHPRGWNTSWSHKRKLKSYQVERNWYGQYAHMTKEHCRVPACIHVSDIDSDLLLIMEDLNASGYTIRLSPKQVTLSHANSCLSWLANFHARFLGIQPEGLWSIGTYWHLDTRPDELAQMNNKSLQCAATQIDKKLNNARYQTFVHGDAKLANFCFAQNDEVAAVDFQYVGKGCGMKDVAYLISSCFDELACEKHETALLTYYFDQLELALDNSIEFQLLKEEWSSLYRYAWADFYRFLDGWSPGHWKMHPYSERITQQVLNELNTNDT